MKRLGSCAALVLLTAGCGSYTSPWLSYDCTVTLINENGEFRYDGDGPRWTYDVAEGLEAVVTPAVPYSSEFLETGFAGEAQPILTVGFFPAEEGMPPLGLAVDLRIGERALRSAGSDINAATFAYRDWSALLAEEGDMRVALIDDRNGAVLRSGTIPRSTLDSIEPTLEDMGNELVDKVLHQEERCTPYMEPGAGIVVI